MSTPRTDLSLVVRRAEGVLVRLLGVTVRRGFEPVEFASYLGDNRDTLDVRMTVESHRPIQTLVSQLAKLYDVERVDVREEHQQ